MRLSGKINTERVAQWSLAKEFPVRAIVYDNSEYNIIIYTYVYKYYYIYINIYVIIYNII